MYQLAFNDVPLPATTYKKEEIDKLKKNILILISIHIQVNE